MESYDSLIEFLEKSVEKNGEKPLTNKWLLNILTKVQNNLDRDEDYDFIGEDPNW